jgi:hypothetical protein
MVENDFPRRERCPSGVRHGQEAGKDAENVRPGGIQPRNGHVQVFQKPEKLFFRRRGRIPFPRKGSVPGTGQHPSLPRKDEIGLRVRNVRLHRQRMVTGRFPVEEDIPGNGSPEQPGTAGAETIGEAFTPGTCSVDDDGRKIFACIAVFPIDRLDPGRGIPVFEEFHRFHVVQSGRSERAGLPEEGNENSLRVRHEGVVPYRPAFQPFRVDGRKDPLHLLRVDHLPRGEFPRRTRRDATGRTTEEIVQEQGDAEDGRPPQALPEKGHQARQGPDHPGEFGKEPSSFRHGFPETRKVKSLEVSESSVDDPEAVCACCAAEIVLFDKECFQVASACLECQHHAVDSAADDDHVVPIRCSRRRIPSNRRHQIRPFFLYQSAVAASPSRNPIFGE